MKTKELIESVKRDREMAISTDTRAYCDEILKHLESKEKWKSSAVELSDCVERGGTPGDFRRAQWEVRECLRQDPVEPDLEADE